MCRQWGKLELVSFLAGAVLAVQVPSPSFWLPPGVPGRALPSPSMATALAQDLGLLHQSLLGQRPTPLEASLTEDRFQC